MLLFPHPFLSCIIIFAIFAFVLFSSIIPLLFSFVPPRVYNHFHCFQPRGAEGKELLLLVVLSTYECMGYVYMCIDITAYAAGEGKKGRGGGGGGGGGERHDQRAYYSAGSPADKNKTIRNQLSNQSSSTAWFKPHHRSQTHQIAASQGSFSYLSGAPLQALHWTHLPNEREREPCSCQTSVKEKQFPN